MDESGTPSGWRGWTGLPSHPGSAEATAGALLAPVEADLQRGDRSVWISAVERDVLCSRIEALLERQAEGADLPLLGVPFGVKDNLDVASVETTAGCPPFAYLPERSATVVQRLESAGAICVGKTNMDQFATGLVGTRSGFGTPTNAVHADLIPGGSSSGSAVAVARGDVAFALGTDTAGSGRVPAALNGIIGIKPPPRSLPTGGMVPAVSELDCISVFAGTLGGAEAAMRALGGPDWAPASGAVRVGAPSQLDGCDHVTIEAFSRTARAIGEVHHLLEVDLRPFEELGDLLYNGPWVAARDAAFGAFVDAHAEDIDPSVRRTILDSRRFAAADVFRAQERRAQLAEACGRTWIDADVLVVPTVPRLFELAEVAARPLEANVELGRYTNFVNFLGLSAIAVPGATRTDGLPFGVTLVGPTGNEGALAAVACGLRGDAPKPNSCSRATEIELAVVGAHLSGFPLNYQLRDRGARLLRRTTTDASYRLYEVPGGPIRRPALERVGAGGVCIEVGVWALAPAALGELMALIEAPLAVGSVQLVDGSWILGFVGEPLAMRGAVDISKFGGWRSYHQRRT